MNDFQVALIAAGAAAVVGVWGYNKWQERQQHRLAEKIFPHGQADALLAGDKEGNREGGAEVAAEPRLEPGERQEPAMTEAEPAIETVAEAATETAAGPGLPPLPAEHADEVADFVVRIDLAEPLPASGLWAMQSRWAGHVVKPMSWLGFDEEAGCWHRFSAHDTRRYGVVVGALQLADRRGAVSDADLSAFFDGVRDLAAQCSGVVDLPGRDDVLMNARNLDDFCAGVDLQLGVNVVTAGELFAGTKLRGVVEAAGLRLLADGCFHALDDAGRTLFTLGNIGPELFEAEAMKSLATHGVAFSLDVPRVADGPAAFDRLLGVARQLIASLNGVLVDGQGKPLTLEMTAGIRARVEQLQREMAQHRIAAGSARALRLFS